MYLCIDCSNRLFEQGRRIQIVKPYGQYAENCEETECSGCGNVRECDLVKEV